MLRSAYRTEMRFGPDPGQTATIVWYRCEPNAKELGFPTPFVSRNYVEKGIWPDVGEIEEAPRPWANGSVPVPIDGQHGPCGPQAIWDDGWPGGPMPTLTLNDYGFAVCCMGQVDQVGWPILELLPLDQETKTARYRFASVLAERRGEDYEFTAFMANQGLIGYRIDSVLSLKGIVTYEIYSVLSAEGSIVYAFEGLLKKTETSVYSFAAAVAQQRTEDYSFASSLGAHSQSEYGFHGVLAALPGIFVHGPGSGIWTTPGGVYSITVFLWGTGGGGESYGLGVGGSGGGGAGFTAEFNTATTPGRDNSWVVQPEPPFIASSFFSQATTLQVTPGEQGYILARALGGVGSGGDVNRVGGLGGQFGDVIGTVYGGGGGGAGGLQGDGNDGENATLTSAGQGGATVGGWGAGGQGGSSLGTTHAGMGVFPGGAGGGQGYSVSGPIPVQAAGAGGQIIVCWYARPYFFHSVLQSAGERGYEFHASIESFVALTADDGATLLTADDGATILTPG